MTAVSSRKAWAVTSHLIFFTATFWPRYSPCRTAGRWDRDQDPQRWGQTRGHTTPIGPHVHQQSLGSPGLENPSPYKRHTSCSRRVI